MRRWLLVFLLAALPWQWAWSAAAPYCRHEAAPGASHLGHHTHQHDRAASDASAAAQDQLDDPSGPSEDLDCTACHGLTLQALPLTTDHVAESTSHVFATITLARYSSDQPRDIERPKWRRTA
ncbi:MULTISPECIES: hypothetical protein [Burkholderiales]|uniref:Cobalt-zinc-cadmium resistance protein n=1 Tax=Piscinibacter gummiphilus TaxID=946333 RepID=A0ABZ0CXP2_9BURK|nr:MULTISPECIES: hypothetical protein [Burkholderiales]MBP6895760.1 hypothetical protein [Pseudacidovorax sp.]WOB09695.1 hypothetical protein RXV79_06425 [Piscinibacter gummiphilus]